MLEVATKNVLITYGIYLSNKCMFSLLDNRMTNEIILKITERILQRNY